MATYTVSYKLPKQERELLDAIDSPKMRRVLREYDSVLSEIIPQIKDTPEVQQIYIDAQDLFRYICSSNGVFIFSEGR